VTPAVPFALLAGGDILPNAGTTYNLGSEIYPFKSLYVLNIQTASAVAIGPSAGISGQRGSAVAIGNLAGATSQGQQAVAIGFRAGNNNQGQTSVAIGSIAGQFDQSGNAIAIGQSAGNNKQGASAIAIGTQAGLTGQGDNAVAFGNTAGYNGQGVSAVAIGNDAGDTNQGASAVAIGTQAGQTGQGANAVAIGFNAGQTSLGINSIAIGYQASVTSAGTTSTIMINATGVALNPQVSNATYIAPIRTTTAGTTYGLNYNISTKEVTYSTALSVVNATGVTGQFLLQNVGSPNTIYSQPYLSYESGNISTNGNPINNLYSKLTGTGLAIGTSNTGSNNADESISIGIGAGASNQQERTIAIGAGAGSNGQLYAAVAIGHDAGTLNQGDGSIAIGAYAGNSDHGLYSIAIGHYASQSNNAGAFPASNNIVLNATGSAVNPQISNATYIAPIRYVNTSPTNGLYYDNTTGEVFKIEDGASDLRLKTDISGTKLGLNFINALNPVEFRWKDKDIGYLYDICGNLAIGSNPGMRLHQGFIAQEVKAVLDSVGVDSAIFRDISDGNIQTNGLKALRYTELIAPIVKAIQEQNKMIQQLQEQVAALQLRLNSPS